MSGVKHKKILIVAVFLAAVFWTAAGIWFFRSLSDKDRATEQIGDARGVTIAEAKQKNSETVGRIKIAGTEIDYPFVQARDNEYYKTHAFDKSYNPAGWVFLDARNSSDLSGRHNIIYLHGKIEGTEFEPARSVIATSGWMKNPSDFVITTSDGVRELRWQVFSIYKIPETTDYLTVEFKNNNELLWLVSKLKGRSVYNFEVPFEANDKMLTFSIKYNNEYIVAIHGKLL